MGINQSINQVKSSVAAIQTLSPHTKGCVPVRILLYSIIFCCHATTSIVSLTFIYSMILSMMDETHPLSCQQPPPSTVGRQCPKTMALVLTLVLPLVLVLNTLKHSHAHTLIRDREDGAIYFYRSSKQRQRKNTSKQQKQQQVSEVK